MPISRGGRKLASSTKARRVNEDEVLSRWDALSPSQRQAATRFEDASLISRIRDAIQDLFQQQTLMQRMGIDLGGPLDPSIFTTSALFTEVFDLPWKIHKSEEFPDAVLMDPDDQPSLMTLRQHFSEEASGRQLAERFRVNLNDFLAHTGRMPMPKAKWKDLFANKPSSVASLEEQLAKLFEQALWAMTLDPLFEVAADDANKATDLADEVLSDDWMDELEPGDTKRKKKKKKKKKVAVEIVEEDVLLDSASFKEDEEKKAVSIYEDRCDLAETSTEGYEELCLTPESEATPSASSTSPSEHQDSSQTHSNCQSSVLQEHYWGSRQRFPIMSELFNLRGRRRTQEARLARQCSMKPPRPDEEAVETESQLIVSECAGLLPAAESERLASPPIEHRSLSNEWKPSQLVRYIWNQTSQMERDTGIKGGAVADIETPSLPSTAASSTPWSAARGYWATPKGDATPTGTCILERNTFLELHYPEEPSTMLRPRSLSPTYMKAADVASLSTNYWHR